MNGLLLAIVLFLATDSDSPAAPGTPAEAAAPESSPERAAAAALPWDIAYTSNAGGSIGIWHLSHGQRRLLTGPFALATEPAWSPDGKRIAFAGRFKNNPDEQDKFNIYILTLESGKVRRLTSGRRIDQYPTWSPDGRTIGFTSQRELAAPKNVYLIDADGTHERRFTTEMNQTEHPTWSPDGKHVAFVVTRSSKRLEIVDLHVDIFVADADGTNIKKLTSGPTIAIGPTWSPDGSRIVFFSTSPQDPLNLFDVHIFSMASDGSDVRQLTRSAAQQQHTCPAWSPDGTKIVFQATTTDVKNSRWKKGTGKLYLMNADGSQITRLTDADSDEFFPAIRPTTTHGR